MTPQEQRLIEDLFDRLAAQRPQGKDRQADALIARLVRDVPDAGYMLVQTALVYEHQLQEAADRIAELEGELEQGSAEPAGGGSFLSGRLGNPPADRAAPARSRTSAMDAGSSVPSAGPRSSWSAAAPASIPPAQAAPSGGGGFFRSAMATAAGVAGGMLAADSLRSLFGGSSSQASETKGGTSDAAAWEDANRTQDELQDAQLAQEDDNDDDWGGDDLSDSIDI